MQHGVLLDVFMPCSAGRLNLQILLKLSSNYEAINILSACASNTLREFISVGVGVLIKGTLQKQVVVSLQRSVHLDSPDYSLEVDSAGS